MLPIWATKRTNRIISKLNLKKLPFKITEEQFCSSYTEMFKELTPLFRYQPNEYAMKWCLSSEKRMRVFFLVFEANELGKEIYKKDKLLTGAYLYEPSNNIELGCAYIKKLKDVYFKNIINDVSSDYCTISAYNTGPGNVAKAISGAMFLKPSVSIVNKKTSQELFQILFMA